MGKTKKYKDYLMEELKKPREAAEYLNASLEDEDPHVFLLALKDVTEALGMEIKIKPSTYSRP